MSEYSVSISTCQGVGGGRGTYDDMKESTVGFSKSWKVFIVSLLEFSVFLS